MRTTFLTYNGDNLAAAQQLSRECDDVKKVPKERIKKRKEKRRRGRYFEEELDSRDDILYRFKGEKPKKVYNTQQREATEIRRENNTQEKKNVKISSMKERSESVKSMLGSFHDALQRLFNSSQQKKNFFSPVQTKPIHREQEDLAALALLYVFIS